jgi:biopolymer transport protein TolR
MRRKENEPEINVTPLVDVVLVLLIIFMVIAPALENGIRLELPAVTTPDKSPKSKLDPVTVSVASTGEVFLEKEVLPGLSELESRLRALHEGDPERRLVLKADAALPYARMRETFASCQRVGFSGIALSVSQKGGQAATEEN